MLRAAIPRVLATPADKRHGLQLDVIDMVGEALSHIENDLDARIATSESSVVEALAQNAALEAAHGNNERCLVQKIEGVATARSTLDEHVAAVNRAKVALDDVTTAQTLEQQDLHAISVEKDALEATMNISFLPLMNGDPNAVSSAARHVKDIIPLCKNIGLDVSLMSAFPAASDKALDARGPFDTMVFEELRNHLSRHIEALGEKLVSGASMMAERAAMVSSTREGVEAATLQQQASRAAISVANDKQREADAALKDSQQALRNFLPTLQQAERERDIARARLVDFRRGPLATFQALRLWPLSVQSDVSETMQVDKSQPVATTASHACVAALGA